MAGRPKRTADLTILSNIVPSAAAEIYTNLEAGKSLWKCAELFGVSKTALTDWLEHPDRIELYKRARTRAASTYAQETIEIADTSAADAAAKDKLRVQTRQWLASRWDRETYGEQKGPQVTINLATLHLDALRRKPITIDAQPNRTAPDSTEQ